MERKYTYRKICKCGRSFLTGNYNAHKCSHCKKKKSLKLKYDPLEVRLAHAHDQYKCFFCHTDVKDNPFTVRFKGMYYTACAKCCRKPKKVLFTGLQFFKIVQGNVKQI
jgi:hypothetical protein